MLKVYIQASAGTLFKRQRETSMEWYGTQEELIQWVYGNQGPLFVEDARVYSGYRFGSTQFAIASERAVPVGFTLVVASWE